MGKAKSRMDPVIRWLTDQIEAGSLQVGDKIPSEYMLAEQFGVNKTTANKAVAALVAQGYVKRMRGAAGTRVCRNDIFPKGRIACLSSLSNSYSYKIMRGIHRLAFGRGYEVVYQTIYERNDYARMWQQIQRSAIDAVVMMNHGVMPPEIDLPSVYLDSRDDLSPRGHWVVSDNEQGSRLLAQALHRAGHQEVAYVCNMEEHEVQKQRRAGFERTFRKSSDGTARIAYYHAPGLLKQENTHIWLELARRRDITAIVFTNDLAMLPFIACLNERGLWPLRDKVLAGFGNMPELQATCPCLTVEQFPEEIGALACQRAIELVGGSFTPQPGRRDGKADPHEIIVQTQLVNESLAALPSAKRA